MNIELFEHVLKETKRIQCPECNKWFVSKDKDETMCSNCQAKEDRVAQKHGEDV